MGMTQAEADRISQRTQAMSEEELLITALSTPPDILAKALLEQTVYMKSAIVSTADALQGKINKKHDISVIGGI